MLKAIGNVMSSFQQRFVSRKETGDETLVQIVSLAATILLGYKIALSQPVVRGVPLLAVVFTVGALGYYYPKDIIDLLQTVKKQLSS